jgi:hypothetical protein
MNYVSFSPLYVNHLTISGLFSLNKSTIELAKPLVPNLGSIPAATFAQLERAQQELGAGMNQAQKSALSDALKALDKERDAFIAEIFRVTGSYLRSSNEAKKSAASTLHLFMVPYKGVASQPVNIETGTVTDMVLKYRARPDLQAAAQMLGIDNLFDELDSKNMELNSFYSNRTTEYAERNEAASSFKPAAVAAYIQFSTSIEQAFNFAPNETITALFNVMDEYRKKYHALETGNGSTPTTNEPVK